MAQFLQETIDDHRMTFDPSHLRDLLDTYLYQIHKANEEGTEHHLFEGRNHGKNMNEYRVSRLCENIRKTTSKY